MSGVYADVNGPRAVEGTKMAIADFGGAAPGSTEALPETMRGSNKRVNANKR